MRSINFLSGSGIRLAGDFYIPEGGLKKHPGIVLCAGPGGGHGVLFPSTAEHLCRNGFAVLRFDYRGFKNSEGARNRLIPQEQVDDIRNALTWLEMQPEVDAERLALWGAATGGSHATFTAGIDRRVKAFVAVNAAGDCGRWLRGMRPYWEWVDFLKEIEEDRRQRVSTGQSRLVEVSRKVIISEPGFKGFPGAGEEKPAAPNMLSLESAEAIIHYRPEEVVRRISPRAAMWVVAETDHLVPTEESFGMYRQAGEPKKLVVIEGEEHHSLYYGKGHDKLMSVSVDWLRKWLS